MTLAVRIEKSLSKYTKGARGFKAEGFGGKPHGRQCFVIYLGCHGEGKNGAAIYIDLSVMPKL